MWGKTPGDGERGESSKVSTCHNIVLRREVIEYGPQIHSLTGTRHLTKTGFN